MSESNNLKRYENLWSAMLKICMSKQSLDYAAVVLLRYPTLVTIERL
jgi:hypothetical protein